MPGLKFFWNLHQKRVIVVCNSNGTFPAGNQAKNTGLQCGAFDFVIDCMNRGVSAMEVVKFHFVPMEILIRRNKAFFTILLSNF